MPVYHTSVSALHITNGDSAGDTLRTFLTERVLVTCDVLHDGPAPAVDGDAWYDVRARWLASTFEADVANTRESLANFDRFVTQPDRHDEIVLWFEHDLFDQLLLIRTLDVIARYGTSGFSRTSVSLICIGEFPGVERFIGLGQLDADQLASLYPQRKPVTADQYSLASEAWRAFRAEDPRELEALFVRLTASAEATAVKKADVPSDATLPFLSGAIQRLFEEYPSTTNGLSRTAQAILRALGAGPLDAGVLFPTTQAGEPRPFMGDLGFFDVIRALASARVPLVSIDPKPSASDLRGHVVAMTDAGRRVLERQADAVALNGIDEWRGGVHLAGADRSPWRWDPERKRLVS